MIIIMITNPRSFFALCKDSRAFSHQFLDLDYIPTHICSIRRTSRPFFFSETIVAFYKNGKQAAVNGMNITSPLRMVKRKTA